LRGLEEGEAIPRVEEGAHGIATRGLGPLAMTMSGQTII
jgi:hypothetical protein